MKMKYPIACLFIWIGFVSAISFMEAWLKFRAPGMTRAIGLSVGKLIFGALNSVEWVFALFIAAFLFKIKDNFLFFAIAFTILILQTVWLLPALNERADLILSGEPLPRSPVHFYYLSLEVIKVLSLFILGFKFLEPISSKRVNECLKPL